MANIHRIYTTAPIDYDGFSTKTVLENAGETSGKPVRCVEIETRDLEWQTNRYGSGMHPSHTPESWEELVGYGLATSTEGLKKTR